MSGFSKLDRYKGTVKAVAKKNTEDAQPEVILEKIDRKTVRVSVADETSAEAVFGENTNDTDKTTPNNEPSNAPSHSSYPVTKPQQEEQLFNQPDSDKNIIFLDKTEAKNLAAEAPQIEQTNFEIPQIKGASLVKLIERATIEKYADPNFQSDFLLTYRSFTTPRDLLNLLIKRYNTPTPKNLPYGELQDWKQNVLRPIRLRVINILRNWVDKHWRDFTEDAEMSAKLHEFLMEDVQQSGFTQASEQLARLWDKKRTDPETEREVVFSEPPPKPILPSSKAKSSAQLGLLDFSSEELARQLTIIEYNLYKTIKPWEFFNQGWTKKNKEVNSPNILKMIARFNEVSRWVTTEIVRSENLKQRTQVLVKFLEVAEKCKQLNNFNAMMEILSGLQSSSVFRLKQTWNGLSNKQKELFEDIKELMSRSHNYDKLRKHFKACNPPLIPYMGLYLTDLTFIEDGNTDLIEGGLINWVKRRRLAAVIKDIQQYQLKPYCLEEVPFMSEYLVNYVPLDEDQAYKMSLQRETRAPEKDESPKERKSLFSGFKKVGSSKELRDSGSPKSEKLNKTQSIKPVEESLEEEEEEFEIQYRAGYKFYDKDSQHNIILEKDPKGEQNDIIIAGTLPKLVERLTYEKYPDMPYTNSFLLTFRTFMTPHELLDLLSMRYNIPPPVNNAADILEKFKMSKEAPIQLRVLNVLKFWVDKYAEDFKEDKPLLAKILEFIEKSMMPSSTMSRAGQNLKAQITNKLDSKEEKKEYQFGVEPPVSILPNVENPTLLDYSPEELARQFTLIDYELLTSIKPLEYLYFNKPSSWQMMIDQQQEEDPNNKKNSLHVVQVIYRFTDIRDWAATEIVKEPTKEQRAKVIEHWILTADKCLSLNNLQTCAALIAALDSENIVKLKSTWKMVTRPLLERFVALRDLMSYRNNYKLLRDKLASVDFPAIPYIGMFLQDMANLKESMPDTIEPGSFINFGKCQKLANNIYSLTSYCQQPYCIRPVPSIQTFLTKNLDIFEIADIAKMCEDYVDLDNDRNNNEDVFAIAKNINLNERKSSGNRDTMSPESSRSSPSVSPRPSVTGSIGNAVPNGLPESPKPSRSQSGSGSLAQVTQVLENLDEQEEESGKLRSASNSGTFQRVGSANAAKDSPRLSRLFGGVKLSGSQNSALGQSSSGLSNGSSTTLSTVSSNEGVADVVDNSILKIFPNAKIATWKIIDTEGLVYGWPDEEIIAKLVTRNSDQYIIPLFGVTGNSKIDKAELSLCVRIGKLYESQTETKAKVVAFAPSVTETVRMLAGKVNVQVVVTPN